MTSTLVYTTRTGTPNHADVIARAHAAAERTDRLVVPCRVTVPEPHERGEFPMTCFACHMVADA